MGVNYKADEHQEEENTYSILDKYFSKRPTLTFPHRNLIQGYYLSLYYRQCGTNQTQPNRKETLLNPGFAFRVCFGFAPGQLGQTQS